MVTSVGEIMERIGQMATAKANFDERWRKNHDREFLFMESDDEFFSFPNAWVLIQQTANDVVEAIDGSINLQPTIETVLRHGDRQYDEMSKMYNQANKSINVKPQRKLMARDALSVGIGILFEGYLRNKDFKFTGLITERIDPRDMFLDDSALIHYDPVGISGIKECVRRRWYPRKAFADIFKDEDFAQSVVRDVEKNGSSEEFMSREVQNTPNNENRDYDAGYTENENTQRGLVKVWEYWTDKELVMIVDGNEEPLFRGENPYERIPFAFYSPYLTAETLYGPSLLEVMTPVLMIKDIIMNLWYMNAKLSAMPLVFVSQATGLTKGTEYEPGFQPVDLSSTEDMSKHVQEVRVGETSQTLTSFYDRIVENERIEHGGKDTQALKNRPGELATQTKKKELMEEKSVSGLANDFMIGGETQRAIIRIHNIIKFPLSKTKDVLINDFTQDENDKLKSAKGSFSILKIDPKSWENFEFNVIIESAFETKLESEAIRDDLMRLLEVFERILGNPGISPDFKEKVRFDALTEQILKTFPAIDTSEIFVKEEIKGVLTKSIEQMKTGEVGLKFPEGEEQQERIKQGMIQNASDSKNEGQKKRLARSIRGLYDKMRQPKEQS